MTVPKPFGVPMTQEFCDFMGFSFTAEEYIEALNDAVEDNSGSYEGVVTVYRQEINDGLKSVPRNLMQAFTRFRANNSWPKGDEQTMGYRNGSYKLMTYREAYPEWNWK